MHSFRIFNLFLFYQSRSQSQSKRSALVCERGRWMKSARNAAFWHQCWYLWLINSEYASVCTLSAGTRRWPRLNRFLFTLVRSFYLHEQFLSPASSTPKASFARDFIQNVFRFSRSHSFVSVAHTARYIILSNQTC